jgi:DNA cross-link repair 1C protein
MSLFFNRFLIEGERGAVLHTGDFRAEPWFINSLIHNPYLQPYLASSSTRPVPSSPSPDPKENVMKTLDAIYLDTACMISPLVVPSKVHTPYSSIFIE